MRGAWLLLFASLPAMTVLGCSTEPEPNRGSGDSDAAPERDGATGPGDAGAPDGPADRDVANGDGGAVVGPLFGFVGSSDGKVRTYSVDSATGAWTLKKESNAGTNPSFLAYDPARRRIVSVDESGGGLVRSFAFDPITGSLTELSSKPSGGAGATHLSLDPTGKWVTVANYTGGNMSILPIDAAGLIGTATDTKASGAMSHWAGCNPSGTHVFVPALGANVVAQYTLNGTTGKLADNGVATLPGGAGPRHLSFHPTEKWAYVINEVAITVTTFDFDKVTGKLTAKQTISALPPGQSTAGVSGAEIFVHVTGKHVYASTRGFDSIAQFSVSAADGTLTRVANAPTGAKRPRSFGMDPEGTLLYAGNQDVNQVVGFKIDAATGTLTSLGKTVDVPGPGYVGLARIP
jgi:6-phosphogluconolactonase